jgi:hypothetical protein
VWELWEHDSCWLSESRGRSCGALDCWNVFFIFIFYLLPVKKISNKLLLLLFTCSMQSTVL